MTIVTLIFDLQAHSNVHCFFGLAPVFIIFRYSTVNLKYYIKLLIFLHLSLGCIRTSAQFHLAKRGSSESFEFTFIKNLIIIPLTINGKGPFNFVLDTGVGVFLITEPSLADSLQLGKLRSINISGFGETDTLKAFVSPHLDIKVNNSIGGNIPAAILEKDAFDLSSYTGIPIHGLLGYEFFNSFIIRINYEMRTIKVYKPETWYIPKKGHLVPITIEAGKPYMQSSIRMSGNGTIKARLVIDTGAGHPVSLESYRGQPIRVPSPNIEANLGVGLGGTISGKIARLEYLKVAKFELPNVIAAFPNFDDVGVKVSAKRSGNIGNAVFKRFHVVFDYGRGSLFLRPNSMYKEVFEHDLSGMELAYYAPDYTRLFIARIETGSAASEAGLRPEDEIIAINFKQIREMNIDEIYRLLHSRDGRSIALTVLPHGETKTSLIIMTLKRRI
ncbi:aspartyl protease family protein [Desertivirga xinjiangensis]|uniref:aspartyl protease family protein n=1 Tax=Desertivirga xinjiangensis TaxID=539206 RepID=UPI00210F0F77|nr:aspartyl protease family protein [Pedobacter xinjiangensis]